jgi:hypothetical protein
MSNFLAIAAVTAALGDLLRQAIQVDQEGVVDGAVVTTRRPDDPQNGNTQAGVNIYLYQVTPNSALRNFDLPTRDASGQAVQQPQAALDLHYLLTFYGNDARLEPQRLLGLVVRALHTRPLLSREHIRQFIQSINAGDPYEDLKSCDLADQIELVRFSSTLLNLEELSKLWSVFFQTPYTLSMAYQASVVLIEASESVRTALPVRERAVYGTAAERPNITNVFAQKPIAGAEKEENAPLEVGDILVLQGKRLRGDQTILRFDDMDISSDLLLELSDTQIQIKMEAPPIAAQRLRVGKHIVQVVHFVDFPGAANEPPVPHKALESNSVAVVLRPSLTIEE